MITAIAAIAVFLIIIFIHELGHFSMALRAGIKVNEFSVGMGPKLLQKTKNDIKYSIRALPIGGYVSIEGEDEESSDPNAFGNASAAKRLSVIVAGVIMNFILGFVLLFFLNAFAQPSIISTVEGTVADKSGIKAGDTILKINDNKIRYNTDINKYISNSNGEEISILLRSEDGNKEIKLTPELNEEGKYLIGISMGSTYAIENFSLVKGLVGGANDFGVYSTAILKGFFQLFTGKMGLSNVGGPIRTVKMIGEFAQSGLTTFTRFVAMFSINLGIFNILPFPALDGGRAVLLLVEMTTGKKLPADKEGLLNLVGLACLLTLMVVVSFNDIISLF